MRIDRISSILVKKQEKEERGLNVDYESYAKVMQALSDPKRVKIVDMLSCGELCACDILEQFDFTQPTLSHHMKVLLNADLITVEKRGTWHHYSLNETKVNQLVTDTIQITSEKNNFICEEIKPKGEGIK